MILFICYLNEIVLFKNPTGIRCLVYKLLYIKKILLYFLTLINNCNSIFLNILYGKNYVIFNVLDTLKILVSVFGYLIKYSI